MKIPVIKLKTIDSTNNYIAGVKENYRPQTFAVVAAEQTAGRGQEGNKWHSEPDKNLLFSVCVFPENLRADAQFMFNKTVSLSVVKALSEYVNNKISIKWPNDIYVEDKKISGILIEHSVRGASINDSVAGIGVNINQCEFLPSLPNPVSLKLLTSKDYKLVQCFDVFLKSFEMYYSKLMNCDWDSLNKEYLQYLYALNLVRKYKYKGNCITAQIIGTDVYGRLQLADHTGKIILCNFKEIEFLN